MNSRREGCRGAHRLVSETLRREGDNLQKINQNQCSTEALKLSSGRGLKFPSGSFCHEAVTGLREAEVNVVASGRPGPGARPFCEGEVGQGRNQPQWGSQTITMPF